MVLWRLGGIIIFSFNNWLLNVVFRFIFCRVVKVKLLLLFIKLVNLVCILGWVYFFIFNNKVEVVICRLLFFFREINIIIWFCCKLLMKKGVIKCCIFVGWGWLNICLNKLFLLFKLFGVGLEGGVFWLFFCFCFGFGIVVFIKGVFCFSNKFKVELGGGKLVLKVFVLVDWGRISLMMVIR